MKLNHELKIIFAFQGAEDPAQENQQVVDLKSTAAGENRNTQNLDVTVEAEKSLLRETRSPAEGKFLL